MRNRCLKPVYRRPLRELHEENNGELPAVLTESIQVLRRRGLEAKGLFNGCREGRKVQLLERAWDQGHNPLKLAKIQDCYAIAESLILWLRALPGPIIPCRLFRAFLQTRHASCQAETLSELHLLFQQMEEWEQQTLMLLLSFLHDYYLVQRAEGFSGNTLGQLFGPVILRGSDGPLPLPFPEDVRAAAEVVDCMIIAFPVVFSDPSPCSSPYHKPPSRARKSSTWRKESVLEKGAKMAHLGAASCGATNENWPVKHLRVNVVAPLQDTDVCCGGTAFSGFPHHSSIHEDSTMSGCHCNPEVQSHLERSRLATVPEGGPLRSDLTRKELELDDLVGQLLCGSMESMLFENDDQAFLARVTSVSCQNTPRYLSSCGESTDLSSDEDMSNGSSCSTPQRPSSKLAQQCFSPGSNLDFRCWLPDAFP